MTTWLEDKSGNKCSVEYFGSAEKAQAALDSLVNCYDCINCFLCWGCLRCSECSRCFIMRVEAGKHETPSIPVIENIHNAVLSAATNNDLNMWDWHTCETTHCRAGWVVHLAGDAGYALEKRYNTGFAAMLIYDASSPALPVSPSRFYDHEKLALADMKRMAELETQLQAQE